MMPTRQRSAMHRLSVAMAVTACLATAAQRLAAPARGADQPLVRDRHTSLHGGQRQLTSRRRSSAGAT